MSDNDDKRGGGGKSPDGDLHTAATDFGYRRVAGILAKENPVNEQDSWALKVRLLEYIHKWHMAPGCWFPLVPHGRRVTTWGLFGDATTSQKTIDWWFKIHRAGFKPANFNSRFLPPLGPAR